MKTLDEKDSEMFQLAATCIEMARESSSSMGARPGHWVVAMMNELAAVCVAQKGPELSDEQFIRHVMRLIEREFREKLALLNRLESAN